MKKISWIEGTLFFLALASVILSVTFHYAADNNRGNVDRLNEKYAIIHSFDADEEIEEETEKEQQNEKAAKLCEKLFGIFLVSALCLLLYHRFKRRNNIETQSRVTGEEEKEALSLANEITVNQAVAVHVHTEATSQVAVADIAVEQSPKPETEATKGQREERPNKPNKAPEEAHDAEIQNGSIMDFSKGRPHFYDSAQNSPIMKTKEQKTRDNARDIIRSRMNNDFCGPQDCIYNRFWVDVEELIKDWPKKRGLKTRIGQIATLLYYQKNESGEVYAYVSDPRIRLKYMSYAKWVKTFFIACGVTPPNTIRNKEFKPIDLATEIPQMKYLRAGSWKYFSDSERIKKYLD